MTSAALEPMGPVLVSELPPVTMPPTLMARLRTRVATRAQERGFEAALRRAAPWEQSDLLAASRRG